MDQRQTFFWLERFLTRLLNNSLLHSQTPLSETSTIVVADAVAVAVDHQTPTNNYDPEAGAVVVAKADVQIVYGHLGRHGQHLQCPFCLQLITTRTRDRSDGITIIFVVVLLVLCWPLCWLPFCMPKCKAVHHYCPQCKNKVGVTEPCS